MDFQYHVVHLDVFHSSIRIGVLNPLFVLLRLIALMKFMQVPLVMLG